MFETAGSGACTDCPVGTYKESQGNCQAIVVAVPHGHCVSVHGNN
jgi:hypothetical protein